MPDNPNTSARLFYVDSKFQKLAKRPGGVAPAAAIMRAQKELQDSHDDFKTWYTDHFRKLSYLIKRAEVGHTPPDWTVDIEEICHQLRDVGSTMGYELLSHITDSLCALLRSVSMDDRRKLASVQCHFDAMQLSVQKQYCRQKPGAVPELVSGLLKVVERARRRQGQA